MTPQEQNMLGELIRRVQTTNLTEKDPEAQALLDQQLGGHPDALYVLAQTVLVQKYALEQAKVQIDQLKQAAAQPQPAKATSFLGSIFGKQDPPPPPPQVLPPGQSYSQGPQSTPWTTPAGGQPYQQTYAQPAYAPAPSGGSSFLRSAATTAAGVAAGALAFEGVESLIHGFGHEAGIGGGWGGGGFGGGEYGYGGGPRVEETVVNNYYDSPGSGGGAGGLDERGDRYADNIGGDDRAGIDQLSPQMDQADDVNIPDDDSGSYDDASLDSSLDSGGSDFSGGDDSSFV